MKWRKLKVGQVCKYSCTCGATLTLTASATSPSVRIATGVTIGLTHAHPIGPRHHLTRIA